MTADSGFGGESSPAADFTTVDPNSVPLNDEEFQDRKEARPEVFRSCWGHKTARDRAGAWKERSPSDLVTGERTLCGRRLVEAEC